MHKLTALYDYINLFATLITIFVIFIYFSFKNENYCRLFDICYEQTQPLRQKNKLLYYLFSKRAWIILTASSMVGLFKLLLQLQTPFLSNNAYFTKVNYFSSLFIGPFFVIAGLLITGHNVYRSLDELTPFYAFEMAIGKFACYFGGCCYGIECSFGLYMVERDRVEFPIQFTEAAVGLIIGVILFICLKKGLFRKMMFPFYMLLFSATRFFTEFLRDDHTADWLGLKPYQILCIVGTVVGAGLMALIYFLDKKNRLPLRDTNLIDYIIDKVRKKRAENV